MHSYLGIAAANAIFSYQTDADGVPVGNQRQTAFKTDDPPGNLVELTVHDDTHVMYTFHTYC